MANLLNIKVEQYPIGLIIYFYSLMYLKFKRNVVFLLTISFIVFLWLILGS